MFLFAGKTLKLPGIETDEGFKNMSGWSIEKSSNNESAAANIQSSQNLAAAKQEQAASKTTDIKQEEPTNTVQSGTVPKTSQYKQTADLGDSLTVEDVTAEVKKKCEETGTPRLMPLKGETNEHLDYWRSVDGQDKQMVCRDASGKTKDIKGKLEIVAPDNYEINPEAFTITDNSSGSDHKYLYRKAAITDDGKLIYKCVSMNGDEISTENQYTLEWKEDGTPELVQYDKQDNFGVGLKTKKANKKLLLQTLTQDKNHIKPQVQSKPQSQNKLTDRQIPFAWL